MAARRIDIRTDEGTFDLHLHHPSGQGAWPLVLLYMDAFGIRPALAGMAERLAAGGYTVAIPNLYYRHGDFTPFEPKAVVVEGPERDRFRGMIASISQAMIMRDTALVLDRLDTEPAVRRGACAAVGYCMGGGYALTAAGTFPDRVVAAASFHGGSLATDKADSPHRVASSMRARVYVGAAAEDPTFPPEQAARLRAALEAAGVAHVMETYDGARHGFAVTGHLAYNPEASERHWHVLMTLLRDTLGTPDEAPAGH